MADKVKMDSLIINGTEYRTTLTKKFLNRKVWERPNEQMIKSFIPGTILKLFVTEGQKVKVGSELLILEAMKMKNVVKSPVSGTIKAIHVKEGVMVPNRELLIEIE
ncbi:MAG: acetyl-CoA carboxylase biotin carboxyl carrier protein subunit [Salinivirgaceae bacterium]|jgi:biotin carboxyl carrier protein|nr:acetyl-CoA carboxylase biotin carboxyl carrier protein subunit [Salinivirgaceae bacterium]